MSEQQQYVPVREAPAEAPGKKRAAGKREASRFFCALRQTPARVFSPDVTRERERAILLLSNKWVSGTTLRYYFFDRPTDGENVLLSNGTTAFRSWVGVEAQRAVVRQGFDVWKNVGMGVKFQEVKEREEAEVRIGFMKGDGAWSQLGRDILKVGPNERTMNFGWDLTLPGEIDTAVHEIGHTLGFPHEHQNPKAGIEWDENAVYAALAKPPNEWDRETTFWNIIRKLPAQDVEGSTWDPDSVMHYPFEKGLIKKPDKYKNGLQPAGGLSAKDAAWVKSLYPPVQESGEVELKPSQSVLLNLLPGAQREFAVKPKESRYYQFKTFGTSDSVLVLFENDNGQLRYRTGDDDSGEGTNAYFRIKLIKGRRYVLRIRLYYSDRPGETSVMMW